MCCHLKIAVSVKLMIKNTSGKIVVYDNWDGSKGQVDKKKFNIIDVFNPNEKVVLSQIEKAGGIENYKGQVLFQPL